jgi:hypothetical protein
LLLLLLMKLSKTSLKRENLITAGHFRISLLFEHGFKSSKLKGEDKPCDGFLEHEKQIYCQIESNETAANEAHLVFPLIVCHEWAKADDWVDHEHQTDFVEHFKSLSESGFEWLYMAQYNYCCNHLKYHNHNL